MARLPRLVIPNQPHHIIQRGNDRQTIFRDNDDFQTFLDWLREAAKQYQVAVHAYVLMSNHLHLLATPNDEVGLAKMMQWVGRHYVPYFNHKYQRSGTLWQGRFKTSVIDSERYFMVCSRYIELNPVRAGIAHNPVEYHWSSYQHHIGLRTDPLITDHSLYWALGNTPFEREASYKALTEQGISPTELEQMRYSFKGWVIGSDQFKAQLEKQSSRRVTPAPKGRPMKKLAP